MIRKSEWGQMMGILGWPYWHRSSPRGPLTPGRSSETTLRSLLKPSMLLNWSSSNQPVPCADATATLCLGLFGRKTVHNHKNDAPESGKSISELTGLLTRFNKAYLSPTSLAQAFWPQSETAVIFSRSIR